MCINFLKRRKKNSRAKDKGKENGETKKMGASKKEARGAQGVEMRKEKCSRPSVQERRSKKRRKLARVKCQGRSTNSSHPQCGFHIMAEFCKASISILLCSQSEGVGKVVKKLGAYKQCLFIFPTCHGFEEEVDV